MRRLSENSGNVGFSLATTGHKRLLPHVRSLLTASHPGPRPPSQAIRQAFDALELQNAWHDPEAAAIVHHGDAIVLPDFDLIHSHMELVAIFGSKGWKGESIPLSSLIDGLALGRAIRGSASRILRHSGRLNRRALRYAFAQIGVRINQVDRATSFGSYSQLAATGIQNPGTLMVGLRGRSLSNPEVQAIRLDGKCPLAMQTHASYPLQYGVHFYLRQDLESNAAAMALDYLEAIKTRMSIDNRFFSDDGRPIH